MWIKKRRYQADQRLMNTTIHITYKGDSIIGPMSLLDLALIAKYGGRAGQDMLQSGVGQGDWAMVVTPPSD